MKKNKTVAKQLPLANLKVAPTKASTGSKTGFIEFMRVSAQEGGLLAPAQAAMVLEITKGRVAQLMEIGQLTRWDFFDRPFVSVREVDERRHRDIKGGRPPRNLATRMMLQGKVLATSHPAQIAAILVE